MGRKRMVHVRLVDGTLLTTFLDESATVAELIREMVMENLEGYTTAESESELDQTEDPTTNWKLLKVLPVRDEPSKFETNVVLSVT
jgi:hypothetical protein